MITFINILLFIINMLTIIVNLWILGLTVNQVKNKPYQKNADHLKILRTHLHNRE